jgi:hypothetical protein
MQVKDITRGKNIVRLRISSSAPHLFLFSLTLFVTKTNYCTVIKHLSLKVDSTKTVSVNFE